MEARDQAIRAVIPTDNAYACAQSRELDGVCLVFWIAHCRTLGLHQ